MNETTQGHAYRQLDVGYAAELIIAGHRGSISVRGDADRSIQIRVLDYDDEDLDGRDPLNVSQEGNQVVIGYGQGAVDLDLEVRAPADCRVTVRAIEGDISVQGIEAPIGVDTVGGDVSVVGARGTCAVSTTSGDISIARVRADCVLSSVDGDVSGSEIEGSLQATTTNGDVEILRSHLRSVTLAAVNSDVTVETPLAADGTYRLSSTNGEVRLLVPPGTGATVHARTQQGNIRTNLPVQVTNSDRRNWHGVIDGGGADVYLESVNGELRIRNSTWAEAHGTEWVPAPSIPAPSVIAPIAPISPISPISPMGHFGEPPEPPSPPEPPDMAGTDAPASPSVHEQTVDLLARLERGEITLEEAMSGLSEIS